MKAYANAFFTGGVVIPLVLHVAGEGRMPWWPDTISLAIAFGTFACAMVWKYRTDREMNRRLWTSLKAAYHRRGSN